MSASFALTPSQARAVHARGINVAVVAGAGAGKTRVLVERYLELLARGIPLKKIVAITFTEKAASEMRDRVRGEIEQRAADPNASALWHEHRRDMDDARISTIHSLCTRLLRANSVEARVDPRFDVLDDQDAALWQAQALDAVLKDLAEGGGGELGLLKEYRIPEVRATLMQLLGQSGMADDAFAQLPDTSAAILEMWRVQLADAQARALENLLAKHEWTNAAQWVLNNSADDSQDKLERIRADTEAALQALDPNNFARAIVSIRAFCHIDLRVGSKKGWADLAEAKARLKVLRELAREFCENFDAAFGAADERAAHYLLLWRALWQRTRSAFAQRKERERVLDFDDLEEKTRALLREHDAVRQRYQTEFTAVLVDEFQDTNAAQREIVYALAAPAQPERLFVVGDGKQSIYGFRGADVTVFEMTQTDVTTFWGKDARVVLEESFRAHTRLVDAFNFLFENIFAVDGARALFQVQYEALRAVRVSTGREPQLEIIEFPKEFARDGEITKYSAHALREWQARELAARFIELEANQFHIWGKAERAYRPLKWGDIALLFRSSQSFPIFEDAFKAARIPYRTLAGKGYYDRPEVRDLLHYLRALENPLDDLALAVVLHSPLFALSSETLYRLRRGKKHFQASLSEILNDVPEKERAHVEFARAVLERGWQRVGRTPILDLLYEVLDATAYLATISALSDGDRRRGNVEKLLALARRTGAARVGDFNQYIQNLTAQEVREGEAVLEADDAVQLMTIHAAKGLEFPMVVLPDASDTTRGDNDLLLLERAAGAAVKVQDAERKWVKPVAYALLQHTLAERAESEEKRLLYVALTRAQDFVIVAGAENAGDKSYLGQIKNALGDERKFAWGNVELRAPRLRFEENPAPSSTVERVELPQSHGMEIPALALPLAMPTLETMPSFSATDLAKLSRDRAEFARHVLEGAPDRVPLVTKRTKTAYAPHHVVGEMTHRALRQWRFPHNTTNLENLLANYARDLGLADEAVIHTGVLRARNLLERFTTSELFRALDAARARRHEVSFVCEWQGRTIHGTMDVLAQTRDGAWFLADFKTDEAHDVPLREHVLKNYAVQLGLYQYAASQALQQDIPVRVHYVRHGETIELRANDLQDALTRAAEALRG